MKLNTLEKLYNCLKYEQPEIILPLDLIGKAKKPIVRMLDISAQYGL
jgi:quinolinate synthase